MSIANRQSRLLLSAALVVLLVVAIGVVTLTSDRHSRTYVTAYFDNTNGMFVGDDVRVLGVRIGSVATIEPQPQRAKVTFWFDSKYKVPNDVKAVILSPALVTGRAIQLTPAYTTGPVLSDNAVIPQDRTAVPVEFDDFRVQLERLAATLQPTQPGGVSTLGAFVNSAADNLRGNGGDIRKAVIALSQAISALGDHSQDLFGTLKSLSILVSALRNSADLMRQLNQNLASVTGLLSNGPNEVGDAVRDIHDVVGDVQKFVADNKDTLSTTVEKLASVGTTLNESLDDIKQVLHVAPNAFQNFINIYQPAQGALTGALVVNNFANPVSFICGAIQAASRLSAAQSAKLCVQYLAPIFKNRQYNFPPIGENLFVGASARPNEITYSEDWMRPDYVPPQPPAQPSLPAPGGDPSAPPIAADGTAAASAAPLPAEVQATNPADGLPGLMVPQGAGQ